MEIIIGRNVRDGMNEAHITFREITGNCGQMAKVTIWIRHQESQEKMHTAAKIEALSFLARTISTHGL